MKPEEQRIAIAEACGWKGQYGKQWLREYDKEGNDVWAFSGTCPDGELSPLPDYLNDLNAMHEAERTLDINQLSQYADELDKICVEVHICPLTHWSAVVCATASQRAEAFLKTIGKWS